MTPIDLVNDLLTVGQRWQQLEQRLCGAPPSPAPLAIMEELLIDPLARLAAVVDPLAAWPSSTPRRAEGTGQRSRLPGVTPIAAHPLAGAANHLSPATTWATDRHDTPSFTRAEPSPYSLPTPTAPAAVVDDRPQSVRLTSSHTALRSLLQVNVEQAAAPLEVRTSGDHQAVAVNHPASFYPPSQTLSLVTADQNAAETAMSNRAPSSSHPQMRTLRGWTRSASEDFGVSAGNPLGANAADYTGRFSELDIPAAEIGNPPIDDLAQPTDWPGDALALRPDVFRPAVVANAGSGLASPLVRPTGGAATLLVDNTPGGRDMIAWPWDQGEQGAELSSAAHFQRDEMTAPLLTDAQIEQVLAALTERLELTLLRAYGATGG